MGRGHRLATGPAIRGRQTGIARRLSAARYLGGGVLLDGGSLARRGGPGVTSIAGVTEQ